MNKMTRLGPHTFVSQDSHAPSHGSLWLKQFDRSERHRLVEEDRSARAHVAAVLGLSMALGLTMLLVALVKYIY